MAPLGWQPRLQGPWLNGTPVSSILRVVTAQFTDRASAELPIASDFVLLDPTQLRRVGEGEALVEAWWQALPDASSVEPPEP